MNNELSLKEKLLVKFKAFLTEIAIMIGGAIGCLFAAIMVPIILYFEFYILFVYVIPFANSLARSTAVTALISIAYLTVVLFFPIYLFSGKDEFGLQQYYREKLSSKKKNSSQNKNQFNKETHNSREQKYKNQEQQQQREEYSEKQEQTKHHIKTEEEYYKILGCPVGSNFDVIRKAYREKAILFHPDKVSHLGPEYRAISEQKMKEINEALQYFQRPFHR